MQAHTDDYGCIQRLHRSPGLNVILRPNLVLGPNLILWPNLVLGPKIILGPHLSCRFLVQLLLLYSM